MYKTIKLDEVIFNFNSCYVLFCHFPLILLFHIPNARLFFFFQIFFFQFHMTVYLRYLIELVRDCNMKARIVENIYFTTGYISSRHVKWKRTAGRWPFPSLKYDFNVWIRFFFFKLTGIRISINFIEWVKFVHCPK